MKLPNYEKALVPKAKITDYLLSLTHRDGCTKAKFFMQFGFSVQQWEILAEALKYHAVSNKIAKTEISYFGIRYIIEGHISSPDKRNPCVRSVWFVENGADIPYFVTAYPLKGKSKWLRNWTVLF
jgi:hypothetical protein